MEEGTISFPCIDEDMVSGEGLDIVAILMEKEGGGGGGKGGR